jgi:hypothetical protein
MAQFSTVPHNLIHSTRQQRKSATTRSESKSSSRQENGSQPKTAQSVGFGQEKVLSFAREKSDWFAWDKAQHYQQGYFVSAERTDMGIMCAAPKGAGFAASFDHLQLDIG